MKHLITVFLVAAIATLTSFTPKELGYKIDAEKSKITWVGKKVTGQHSRTVNLSKGNFTSKQKESYWRLLFN